MKKLFSAADSYIARMNWKDMALVKLCLCAAGIMLKFLPHLIAWGREETDA